MRRQFDGARVMRWDQDAVRRSGGYAAMLQRVIDWSSRALTAAVHDGKL